MKNIPKLRFPEFRDAAEWETKPLKNRAENLDNLRVPITESERSKGDIPYYGASGIIDYVEDYIFNEDLLCVSEDGANLVMRNYPIAFSIAGKTWVNNHAHVLRFKEKFTQIIIENYLNSMKLDDYLTGMAQPKLNKAMLDSIPIPLPFEPKEQQKIADCLSSIDELITSQAAKVEALKTHKKALMQRLFPQDGESIPRLRFHEFQNAPEWEEKQLYRIIDFKSGYAFSSSGMSNEVQRYQIIKMSNVYQNTLALDRNPSYWHKVNKAETDFLLNQGDVVLTLTGTVGKKDYGYSAMIEENDKFLLNQRLVRLRAIDKVSVSKFIKYLVLNEIFLDSFFTNSRGGTGNQSNVSVEDLKHIKLPLPQKEEQQKIADCLSSLDELITAQQGKVEALKEHKKALMQRLFPSSNEK